MPACGAQRLQVTGMWLPQDLGHRPAAMLDPRPPCWTPGLRWTPGLGVPSQAGPTCRSAAELRGFSGSTQTQPGRDRPNAAVATEVPDNSAVVTERGDLWYPKRPRY
ncbi:unnamed protein product [Lota lota]